jgi:DNA-binding NarL/FixJ family response regulator
MGSAFRACANEWRLSEAPLNGATTLKVSACAPSYPSADNGRKVVSPYRVGRWMDREEGHKTLKRIKLLLADDQVLFADSLAKILARDAKDIEIVGIARDGEEAVRLAEKTVPDVVLMDVRMPVLDGIAVKVIVLTTFDDDAYAEDAIRCGAIGYLLKSTSLDDLIAYVRITRKGTILVSNTVADKIVAKAHSSNPAPPAPPWMKRLSQHQLRILALLARGFDNASIASTLNLGDQTVKNYVR